jgi:hypothetical protein
VGERGGKNGPPTINSEFERRDPCLYFIWWAWVTLFLFFV